MARHPDTALPGHRTQQRSAALSSVSIYEKSGASGVSGMVLPFPYPLLRTLCQNRHSPMPKIHVWYRGKGLNRALTSAPREPGHRAAHA